MGRFRRYWPALAAGAVLAIVASLALWYANDRWLSGVVTASVIAWLAGLLALMLGGTSHRPAVVGAVLAGFLYVLFALGPWFRVHVGPWLLTSQALVHVETNWLGRQPQVVQQLAFTNVQQPYPLSWVYGTGSGLVAQPQSGVLIQPQITAGQTFALVGSTGFAGHGQFVAVGHWLCGWLAAGLGAIAAAWIARPRAKSSGPAVKDEQP